MRNVAKDFGSYYPHYPKKTSVGPVTNIESITVSGLTSVSREPLGSCFCDFLLLTNVLFC